MVRVFETDILRYQRLIKSLWRTIYQDLSESKIQISLIPTNTSR